MAATSQMVEETSRKPALKRAALRIRYTIIPKLLHAWHNVFSYKNIALSAMDYEQYWDQNRSAGDRDDPRIREFLRLIDVGSTVAEIGCGDGTLLSILQDQRNARVKGYDVSERAVNRARAKGLDVDVRDASAHGLDETFDFVILADCLEHLAEPERLISALRGKFRTALLISIPNSCYWRYRVRVLFGRFMVQWVAHPGEHLRFWSISDMHWWIEQLGLEITAFRPTWGVRVLKHMWPAMFAQNVIYVISDKKS